MKEIDVAIFILIGALTITLVSSTPALLLTPYILKNQTETARNLSAVDPQLFLNVTSFSGYLTVNEKHNSNLFFWYFPPANKTVTEKTPWIIWLQGGPGASSLAGLFVEIGPFMYDFHDETLKLREWSWTRNYPLLFIDNPVGAGFSFTDSDDGYAQNMDDVSMHLYSALQQFLEVFPEHRRAPLYLAGESYAGHYLPAFGHRILHPPTLGNFKIKDTSVNLKGIMMGNPIINRRDEMDLLTVFYQWGLLDAEGVEEMKPLQQRYDDGIRLNNFSQARIARDRLLDKIQERISQPQLYNVLRDDTPEIYSFQDFVARPHIKEAIHTGDVKFRFHKATAASKLEGDFLTDLTPKVEELLEHYKVMIYCGQLDLMAPCVPNAEARRRTWRWSGRKAFLAGYRNPWFYNQTLAGYIKIGGNFTEVLVRNAGHLVPMDKPAEAFDLINDFIYSKYLPLPASYVETFNDNLTYNIETPNYPNRSPTETLVNNTGLVVSVVLNVIFVAVIIGGTVHWIRWKKRTDSYFYSMVDNEILDGGLLTMD